MSYNALSAMYESMSLRKRIVAAAAEEGIANPDAQVGSYLWQVIARSDWKAAWGAAVENYTEVYNPDTGARPDVITDAMILTAIQSITNSNP